MAAHERGDHQRAAEEFARADAIAPSPVALHAALDAAVDADDPALGAELLERSARAPASGELARSIALAKQKLGGRAGRIEVTCPAAARCMATVDGRPFEVKKPGWVRAGQHTVVVQVDGEAQTRLVEVKANATTEVAPGEATAPEPPAPAPLPPEAPAGAQPASAPQPPAADPGAREPSRGLPPFVFFAGIGATAAVGVGAVVLGLATKSTHDDFVAKGCEAAAADGCADLKDQGQDQQLFTNVAIGGAALLALGTAVVGVAFTDWGSSPREAKSGRPVFAPLPGGAAAGWAARF